MKVVDINIESPIQRTPKQTVVCSDRGCCPIAVDVDVLQKDEPVDPKKKKAPAPPSEPRVLVDIECTTVEGGETPSCKTFKKLQV